LFLAVAFDLDVSLERHDWCAAVDAAESGAEKEIYGTLPPLSTLCIGR